MDRGAWQATVHGITQSWTRLRQFSTHTERYIYIYIYTHTHTHTHTLEYNGMLFSHERERNLVICNNALYLEGIMLNGIS